jgi:hypothetical protein
MLTKVCNLNEITTALPGNSRRFTIDDTNPIWVDLGKVMVARVLDGNLVLQSGDEMSVDHKAKFIELYLDGNLCVVTLFTDEVKNNLPLCLGEVTETARKFNGKNGKYKDDGKELPFNERKALPSKDNDNKKKDIESWN